MGERPVADLGRPPLAATVLPFQMLALELPRDHVHPLVPQHA